MKALLIFLGRIVVRLLVGGYMELTNRAKRRAHALAMQIHSAGRFIPCYCGEPGCYTRATRREIADKIIRGQYKILKLNETTIREALRQVQLI